VKDPKKQFKLQNSRILGSHGGEYEEDSHLLNSNCSSALFIPSRKETDYNFAIMFRLLAVFAFQLEHFVGLC
jgi:hypothetical protein